MTDQSLVESAGLRQPCADCGQFEASLLTPTEVGIAERFVCELCAAEGDLWRDCTPFRTERPEISFVWVDLAFLDTVAPHLSAVEFRTYLAIVRLTEGHRKPFSQTQIAHTARVDPRNVSDACTVLQSSGLVRRLSRGRNKPSRWLVVRPHATHRDPAIPCLVQPGIYERAARRMEELHEQTRETRRGKRRELRAGSVPIRGSVQPVPITGSVLTGSGDRCSTDQVIGTAPSICPDQIRSNHCAEGKPTHPPYEGQTPAFAGGSTIEQAADTAAGDWGTYSRAHIVEALRKLLAWSGVTGQPATCTELAAYLRDGARTEWLKKAHADGRVRSPLHLWCQRETWLKWLHKGRQAATRKASQDRMEHIRALPVAERVAHARATEAAAKEAMAVVDRANAEQARKRFAG